VTGIGAKSLSEVLPGAEKVTPVAVATAPKTLAQVAPVQMAGEASGQDEIETQPAPIEVEAESLPAVPVDILNDLDVPAFMRKRARFNARVGER
jgi:hypothetical protein